MDKSKLTVSLALGEQYGDLKLIWKICFSDSDEYIDFFFKNRINSCYPIVATYDNKVIGGMYLMPVTAYEYSKIKKGLYGYAIGVLPEYRKNGVYRYIHSKIDEYITEKNMFYILSPANEKLCEYYKSLGFIENAYVCEETYEKTTNESKRYVAEKLDVNHYFNLRQEYFKDKNPIIWDSNALQYVLDENSHTDGENLYIKENENEYFVLLRKGENEVTVIESNIDNPSDFNNFILDRYKCNKIRWIKAESTNKILYGLTCNLKKNNYYLNLILN